MWAVKTQKEISKKFKKQKIQKVQRVKKIKDLKVTMTLVGSYVFLLNHWYFVTVFQLLGYLNHRYFCYFVSVAWLPTFLTSTLY